MGELYRRLLEEEKAGAHSLEELSDDLRRKIDATIDVIITHHGFKATKSFLEARNL